VPVAPKLIAASALPESARVRIRLRFKSRRIPCALGRITRKTQTLSNGNTRSIGYQYDASGTASTSVTHQYDAAGKLQSDGLHQYHYDSQGRLQSSQTGQGPDAPTTRYAHNALSQRVFKTEPLYAAASSKGAPTDSLLDDEEEDPSLLQTLVDFFTRLWNPAKSEAEHLGWAYVYDEDGSLLGEYGMGGAQSAGQSQYIYLPTAQGPIPMAAEIDNRLYAIHTDHLGTPRRLTQADGQAAWQWAYTPYGDEAPTLGAKRFTNETTNPSTGSTGIAPVRFNLRYPGQYFDEESGLHYNYFRSYDPRTGRYTQTDPIGLDGGWNRFSYVEGNPLSMTDPEGLKGLGGVVRTVTGLSGRPDSVEQMSRRYEKDINKKDGYSTLNGPSVPVIPQNLPACVTVCPNEGNMCKPIPNNSLPAVGAPGCYQVCYSQGMK
jgi:RHS repeat-associated protein